MGLLKKLFGSKGPPASAAQLGRNEPCWCGSGKKYKQCHYHEDRDYLARQRAAACRGSS